MAIHICEYTAVPMIEGRPRAQHKTKVDSGGVESIDHLIKVDTKIHSLIKMLCSLHQTFSNVPIDTPILLLDCSCQDRPGHRPGARPKQILCAKFKCSLNIFQSKTVVSKLRKAQHHELVPAVELYRLSVAAIAIITLRELVFVDERHDLRKNGFILVHDLRTAA